MTLEQCHKTQLQDPQSENRRKQKPYRHTPDSESLNSCLYYRSPQVRLPTNNPPRQTTDTHRHMVPELPKHQNPRSHRRGCTATRSSEPPATEARSSLSSVAPRASMTKPTLPAMTVPSALLPRHYCRASHNPMAIDCISTVQVCGNVWMHMRMRMRDNSQNTAFRNHQRVPPGCRG